jgi:hypothetical protein
MSTIAVTNVKHPSAVDPALVLDASGGVNVAGMGLVHIATESFSAVSSVSMNNVFTNSYQNYLIKATFTGSTSGEFGVRLRASGTDASGNNYNFQRSDATGTTLVGSRATSQSKWFNLGLTATGLVWVDMNLYRPQEAVATAFSAISGRDVSSSVDSAINVGGHTLTNSYDGMTLLFVQNATGVVRIYGYANN